MIKNTVLRRALNINGRAVVIVWAVLFIPFALYLTTLEALTVSKLGTFNADRLVPWAWMTDRWFYYTTVGMAVLTGVVLLIVFRPPGQRYRFRASSLHWRNLRNGFPVAVSAVGALVRNNVPASVFVALTVAAICGMWLGSRIDSPELVLSSVSLLLLVLFLLVPFHSLAAKEPTILIGAVPAFAIATSYILVVEPRLALLSVGPAVIFLGAWIPTQYMLLQLRKRWISRRRLGPFFETLTFISLAAPWLAAAYWFPAIFIDEHDQTISLCVTVLTGLVWSKLISDPFAKFVRSIL
ncbi:MAG: hypothetical protein OXI91_14075 [Chloroflexota bacterium]|nr:hypothetical protein [Chloroflexota bacterium]